MNTVLTTGMLAVACLITTIPVLDAWAQEDTMADGAMMAGTGTIQIGGLFPLTGNLASIGEQLKVAAELAVDDLNAYLTEQGAGWQVEMMAEDTGTNPVRALERLQSLHAQGISLVVGPATSSAASHIKVYADSNDMLLISCCSSSPALAIAGDSIYRLIPDDLAQGVALAAMLHADGITGLVPIWSGEPYGDGLRHATAEAFEGYGGEVHAGVRYDPVTFDFGLEVALLNEYVEAMVDKHGADKVAVLLVSFYEGQLIMQSAYNFETLGQVKWYGGEVLAQAEYLIEDDTASEFAAEVDFTTVLILDSHGGKTDEVRDRVAGIVGTEPVSHVHRSYDSIWVLGKAIMAAHSAEARDVKTALADVVDNYSGALGSTKLNAAGDLEMANYQIWKIVDNAWTKGGIYAAERSILTAAKQPEGEVLVGSLYPLTDGLSPTNQNSPIATHLGVDHFNEFLDSINVGWDLVLVPKDTASDPNIAFIRALLLDIRGVDIIIGPPTSASVSQIKPYADRNNMVLISCCSTAPRLAMADDSIFRLVPDDSKQGIAVGKLLESEGIEVVVPLWRGDVYGDGLRDATKANFESRGYAFTEGVRYDPARGEFGDTVSLLDDEVRDAIDMYGSDKVAVFLIAFDESVKILQDASRSDTLQNVRWFIAESLTKQSNVLNDPITRDFVINTKYTGVQVAESSGAIHDMVESYFVEKDGRTPVTLVYHAYDAAWLVGLSILQSGATDADSIKTVLPDVASQYVGAIGGATLNEAGDLAAVDYTVWSIIDGEWTAIGNYSLLDDSLVVASTGAMSG